MVKKILLILAQREKEAFILKKLLADKIEEVCLCPIEYNAVRLAERLNKSIPESTPIKTELVDFVDVFNKKAFDFKQDYINFIHNSAEKEFIRGLNLKQYFTYPCDNFSVWWFSLISEKNPYKSRAFTFFSKVLTILYLRNVLGCEQIWLSNNSGQIHNIFSRSGINYTVSLSASGGNARWLQEFKIAFIEILRVIKFILVLLKKIIDVKKFKVPAKKYKQRLRDSDLTLITAFPFIDEEKLKLGRFVNTYYGSLQEAIEGNHKKKVIWLGMFAPVDGYSWERALKVAGKIKKTENFFMLEEWLGFGDFCKIIFTYLRLAARCVKKLNKYSRHLTYQDPITNFKLNFWDLLNKDFLSSFLGKILIWSITDYQIFSNVISDLSNHTKVLYFAEMQGWEKALNIACKKGKDILCIGMQHTIVPLLFLNYFDHPDDLTGDDYLTYSPVPDYLGCVGSITRDIFLNNNWPKEKLFILGGFRFSDFANNVSILGPRKTNQIIVPFANYSVENQEMLLWLYYAFNDKNLNFKILLKSHPCCPAEKMAKKMRLNINSRVFEFTKKRLRDIVPESRAMIVKESSSVFWALYHKIPVLVPLLYDIVDLCPISGISSLVTYVKSPAELFSAIDNIMHNDNNKVDEQDYQRILNDYLKVYPRSNQYYHNLMEGINK